jgi:hypothetical protein
MENLIPKPALTGEIRGLQQSTSARIGVWRAGTRPLTATFLQFRLDQCQGARCRPQPTEPRNSQLGADAGFSGNLNAG